MSVWRELRIPSYDGTRITTLRSFPTVTPGLVAVEPADGESWKLCHVRSGLVVAWFNDPESTQRAASLLRDVLDWTAPAAEVAQSSVGKEVPALLRSVGGDRMRGRDAYDMADRNEL